MAGDENESGASLYRVVADRCISLEASHAKLKEELSELVDENNRKRIIKKNDEVVMQDSDEVTSDSGMGCVSGFFAAGSPYKRVLESIGHAVHVCNAASGEIIYWNRSAEHLYGWKESEVLGQSVAGLIVSEEYSQPLNRIVERLSFGQSWSGRFPFKKKSGEIFMAMVSKSPLYEDGKLSGIITVSSDAQMSNGAHSENLRTQQDRARIPRINWKRIQWHPRPPIAPVPQIASSSVSAFFCLINQASKLILRKNGDDTCDENVNSKDKEHTLTKTNDVKSTLPGALASKVLAKLNIGGISCKEKEDDISSQENGLSVTETYSARGLESSSSHCYNSGTEYKGEVPLKRNSSLADKKVSSNVNAGRSPNALHDRCQSSLMECKECHGLAKPGDPFPKLGCLDDMNDFPNVEALEIEDEQRPSDGKQFPSVGESSSSNGSSTSRGEKDSNSVVKCEIHWEELQLGEEIGQGSYGVVYRGIWNGSDVAVKLYFGNQFKEETVQDYKKEIDIMKTLRHPNVLLFMGAVHSPERLAIVTEFMLRGSLFKTLHKNNQVLDIRRRLRMALDVARGMNYLHHRNPPIVHRDLKSSNLLVDRNWTVKVGDFGLSRWKNATFITAKSGRGTPQWMAPEVLRNEPSNEKSDVFSFGVILWELMTVSIPWINLNSVQVVGVVGFMDRRLELPEDLDPKVASLIRDCWQSDPGERPSFEDIIHRMTSITQRGVAISPRQRASS
ncbi:map3k delta-1 protein kinase, putative [Ricinus communis]|uniref:non-specific serine/threonine protein kinase n=1 Tax=Ricinus communis TaxID=3988 RepID=B9RC41_RICCO|nr:map3k delta-1 protein kinase, putative [Ricinus communis]